MNALLLTILALSGALELTVGLWALLGPTNFAHNWLGSQLLDPGLRVLIFVVGLASLGMAALHAAAIRLLQAEKDEGYQLTIGLGVALTLVGIATFGYAKASAPELSQSVYLLGIDGLRGLILAVAGFAALKAPATVTQLRLPEQRGRSHGSSRRDTGRPTRRGERRGTERVHGTEGERRRRRSTRDGGGRSSSTEEGRRERRSREATRSTRTEGESPRRRRSSTREEAPGEGRERRGGRRPQGRSLRETEDARSLNIVVSGRPADGAAGKEEIVRPGAEREREVLDDARVRRPRQPMVPSIASEEKRTRRPRSDRDSTNSREERGARSEERSRPSRRRRRPEREPRERRPRVEETEERGDLREEASPPQFESPREPAGNRLVERVTPIPQPEPRPISTPEAEPPVVEEPAAFEQPVPASGPIDRLSAFDSSEKVEGEAADTNVAFGRHRRPFTARRKARQVKPPATKNLQALGGSESDRPAEPSPEPQEKPDRPQPPLGGKARMPDGIGPVEFDQPEEEDDL